MSVEPTAAYFSGGNQDVKMSGRHWKRCWAENEALEGPEVSGEMHEKATATWIYLTEWFARVNSTAFCALQLFIGVIDFS